MYLFVYQEILEMVGVKLSLKFLKSLRLKSYNNFKKIDKTQTYKAIYHKSQEESKMLKKFSEMLIHTIL